MPETRRPSSPKAPPPKGRPKVFVTRELTDAVMDRMEQLFDTTNNRTDAPLSHDQLRAGLQECDVLVPTVTDEIDAALIDAAGPNLKLSANYGAGVNHIDLKAARARGIIVTNTPGVLTEDTADMTMALILSVPRRLAEGEKLVRSGQWTGWSPGGCARAPSACRSIITIATACPPCSRRNSPRPGTKSSTTCSRRSIS
jgi:glyoxylate reductase